MKNYVTPKVEVIAFDYSNAIAVSNGGVGDGGVDGAEFTE